MTASFSNNQYDTIFGQDGALLKVNADKADVVTLNFSGERLQNIQSGAYLIEGSVNHEIQVNFSDLKIIDSYGTASYSLIQIDKTRQVTCTRCEISYSSDVNSFNVTTNQCRF